jgi:membrane protease YdiL (CAAX protease family)
MSENQGPYTLFGKSPLLQLSVTILIIMTVGMIMFSLLFLVGGLIAGIDISEMSGNFLVDPGEENLSLFRYLMIIQEIAILFVPALMVRSLMLPVNHKSLKDNARPPVNEMIFVVVLVFCLFPINGITGELNGDMKLPGWLSGVEEWISSKENEANGLISLLITSDTIGLMFLNIFILAVLPAICEELLFRGVFQRIFYGFFRSPHSAIWIISFLFSFIHLQFYGFLPRLILGLTFGYLYYWSGTLWLPMLAHFVNNAVPVVFNHFQTLESAGPDPQFILWKELIILPVPATIAVLILLYFRNKFKTNATVNQEVVPEI